MSPRLDFAEMANSVPGRSFGCGFLARSAQDGDRYEVDWPARTDTARLVIGGGSHTAPGFGCFLGAASLLVEARDNLPSPTSTPQPTAGSGLSANQCQPAIARTIQRDRNCPKWTNYTPGRDPLRRRFELRLTAFLDLTAAATLAVSIASIC